MNYDIFIRYIEEEMVAMILRVLMVDSSYQARRDIDKKVNWVENDFELVGEANNGW